MSTEPTPVIHVSAVVLRDEHGRVLTVRKRGTDRFMFPGGKPEGLEKPDEAALREVSEEIGIDLDPSHLSTLGDFTAAAANEEGCAVAASVFTYGTSATEDRVLELAPAGEIEELRWVDLTGDWPRDLAPLLSEAVFPRLLEGPGADRGPVPAVPSRHVGVVIRRSPQDVYAYAADPDHLSAWASSVATGAVERDGDDLLVTSPMGPLRVRFVPPNDLGVLDHDVTLPDGSVVTNPLRVLPHPAGAEVVFTVRRLGMSDDEFAADLAAIRADLERLREVLED